MRAAAEATVAAAAEAEAAAAILAAIAAAAAAAATAAAVTAAIAVSDAAAATPTSPCTGRASGSRTAVESGGFVMAPPMGVADPVRLALRLSTVDTGDVFPAHDRWSDADDGTATGAVGGPARGSLRRRASSGDSVTVIVGNVDVPPLALPGGDSLGWLGTAVD